MKIYKYILAFFACWIAASITLFLFDYIWPPEVALPIANTLTRTFVISVLTTIIVYFQQKRENRKTEASHKE